MDEKPSNSAASTMQQQTILAAIAFVLVFVVLYPWGQGFNPEGNWLRGPLWLFSIPSATDWLIGAIVAIPLLTAAVLPIAVRSYWAYGLSAAAVVSWIAFGAYLAMLAVI
jgi:hypothetical protein